MAIKITTYSVGIAAFSKTPFVSTVKTRLAKNISTTITNELYTHFIKATEGYIKDTIASSKLKISGYWALAENTECNNPLWQKLNTIKTGTGGLGNRLHNVYSKLLENHQLVILLGCDSPQISKNILLDTIDKIYYQKNQFVLGASNDGGFYILAGNTAISKNIWLKTPYSNPNTFDTIYDFLNAYAKIALIEPAIDVDNIEDLRLVYEFLSKEKTHLLIEQKNLCRYIEKKLKLKIQKKLYEN